MDIKTAATIELSKYKNNKQFQHLCQYAKMIGIGENEKLHYVAPGGKILDITTLVRLAERSYSIQGNTQEPACTPFLLTYLCSGFIDFEVLNQESIKLAKSYNAKNTSAAPEKLTMAAVLMVIAGEEQRKVYLSRRYAAFQNNRVKDAPNVAVWQCATPEEHLEYGVDVIVRSPDETVLSACQMEHNEEYFDQLRYLQETARMSQWEQKKLDRNRTKLNHFLEEYPMAKVQLQIYHINNTGGFGVTNYSEYTPVQPLGLS